MAQRIYLGIVGGILIASGLFAFIDPHALGEWLGIAAIDVTGKPKSVPRTADWSSVSAY